MNGRASSCDWTSTVTRRSCMHSSRPDCVLGEARLISSTSTTLAKTGPGRNSKRVVAPVEDLRADDVGRQQVGGALDARELEVERARDGARERRLADARQVLDQDVALGEQRDDARPRRPRRAPRRRRGRAPRGGRPARWTAATSSSATRAAGSPASLMTARRGRAARAARRRSRGSRAATSAFVARGHVALAGRGDDRDLVVDGVEADARGRDVVDDDRVEALARELVAAVVERARAVLGGEADERLAGAARGGQRGEHVGGRLELERQARRGRPS